uniref:Uncharacterized protein n=1 Tax=Kalanchoe fedtschenkoi TaxID=63787 RepID=A0A7N0T155_KALFE
MAPSSSSSFIAIPSTKPQKLRKVQSWAPDSDGRAHSWEQKRRSMMLRRSSSSPSITDHDVDELKACFDLGFGFDSSNPNPRLVRTFPALHLYYEVVRKCASWLSRSSSESATLSADSNSSDSEPCSLLVSPGDDPETAKTKLKQWAQVVACSLRDSASTPPVST